MVFKLRAASGSSRGTLASVGQKLKSVGYAAEPGKRYPRSAEQRIDEGLNVCR